MSKVKTKAVFKQCSPQQLMLLPPSLDEMIPDGHLVRVINDAVDRMDISDLINQYEGGGTSAYHPRMMLKVLLYAYAMKIYTGRRIARALSQDITFMWLSGMSRPDFRTINNFRSGVLKDTIESLFKSMLSFLIQQQYIRFEHYFCDGSTFSADANRHKIVWKKNAQRYKQATEEKCLELFAQIDALNAQEDSAYGEKDLEERGNARTPVTPQELENQAEKLNAIIAATEDKRKQRKAQSLQKKVKQQQAKLEKYQAQQQQCGNRSGYSKTDPDASAMKMKDEQTLPAYNVLIGSEDQFIINYSIHQNPNDGTCFKDHMQQLEKHTEAKPKDITADSIFGTEENYELLEKMEAENYMKYPSFHKEQTRKHKENPFVKENMPYDESTDSYNCPNQRQLLFRGTKTVKNKNGYESTVKVYECADCEDCPFAAQCKGGQGRRTIQMNAKLEAYKQQARANLSSEEGKILRSRRGEDVESCFGDIKKNQGFVRFHLRGIEKVKAEFGIVSMAHNLRKICFQQQQKAA